MIRRPPRTTLFPYPTLVRAVGRALGEARARSRHAQDRAARTVVGERERENVVRAELPSRGTSRDRTRTTPHRPLGAVDGHREGAIRTSAPRIGGRAHEFART